MKTAVDPIDSDSAHTTSDSGKKFYDSHFEVPIPPGRGDGQVPADPDAGLSEEERARIVRTSNPFKSNVPC